MSMIWSSNGDSAEVRLSIRGPARGVVDLLLGAEVERLVTLLCFDELGRPVSARERF